MESWCTCSAGQLVTVDNEADAGVEQVVAHLVAGGLDVVFPLVVAAGGRVDLGAESRLRVV